MKKSELKSIIREVIQESKNIYKTNRRKLKEESNDNITVRFDITGYRVYIYIDSPEIDETIEGQLVYEVEDRYGEYKFEADGFDSESTEEWYDKNWETINEIVDSQWYKNPNYYEFGEEDRSGTYYN